MCENLVKIKTWSRMIEEWFCDTFYMFVALYISRLSFSSILYRVYLVTLIQTLYIIDYTVRNINFRYRKKPMKGKQAMCESNTKEEEAIGGVLQSKYESSQNEDMIIVLMRALVEKHDPTSMVSFSYNLGLLITQN